MEKTKHNRCGSAKPHDEGSGKLTAEGRDELKDSGTGLPDAEAKTRAQHEEELRKTEPTSCPLAESDGEDF